MARSMTLARPATRAVALFLLAGTLLLACGDGGGSHDDELRGSQQLPLPDVSGVTLPDATADDADFAFRADEGHVLLVYFGYTSCPDVCPTTLSDIRAARRKLGDDDAARVDLAMATIDPGRDTGDILTGYVRSFVPDAHALVTTDDDPLRAAAAAFGASYSVTPGPDDEDPEVAHSAFVYAVDPTAHVQVTWSFGTTPDDLAHDLRLLLHP